MRVTVRIAILAGVAGIPVLAQAADVAAAPDTLEEIEITGSRVISNGNDSPTPVTVVGTEDLSRLTPSTIADALNVLPVFSGSKTQDSNVIGTGIFGGGNPSANSVDLRNLGLNDTLVLVNGQRIVSTLLLGNIDVDMIPDMLIQRVDVVTGGVSAVYGSDALAGVVNYVYDKNFNGMKAIAQYTQSSRDDDKGYKMGLAGGTALFGGRLHLEGSIQRYETDGILSRLSRPNWAFWGLAGTGSAGNPYTLLNNLRNSNNTFGGLIGNGPLKGYTFNSDGIATPFNHGITTGSTTVEVGGDGSYPNTSLVAPEQMNNAFARADFKFTDTMNGHVQVILDDKKDYQISGGTSITNYLLSTSNAFLTPAQQAALAPGGATFSFSKAFPQSELPALKSSSEEQQLELDTGLDGKVGKYDWALTFNYGRSALYDIQYNNINQQALSAALDAVSSGGQVVCRVTTTNPASDPGCVPLNPFGPSAASPAAIGYVSANTPYVGVFKLYDVNGQVTGDLFNIWAGPVTGALSAEWRRQTFSASSGMDPTLLEDCTGLRFNCLSTTGTWLNNLPSSPQIRLDVKEAALEFNIPLAKDLAWARAVNLNLAARAVSYSTVGDYYPYKIGPEWKITDSLRLRGTYSRDISAPPLYELFQPLSTTLQNVQDQLTLKAYSVPSYNEANPKLKSQVGITKTLGLVWQPAGTGFSVSSDYYHILIKDAIIRVNVFQAQYQQACYSSGGTSPYCAQIIRPSYTDTSASNVVTAWISNFNNIATQETWGDDLEMNYAGRVAQHPFSTRLLVSYQPHIVYVQPGNDTYDMGGVANGPTPLTASPSIRLTAWGTFAVTDRLSAGIVERWRNAMKMTGNTTGIYAGNVFVPNRVAAVGYTDVNLSYAFGSDRQVEVFFNAKNIFDTPPPPATFTINQMGPGPGYAEGDDPIGTRFTVGVRATLF
jgi:outer membrane receptor protein involved in Fe transport